MEHSEGGWRRFAVRLPALSLRFATLTRPFGPSLRDVFLEKLEKGR